MAKPVCCECKQRNASLRRPRNGALICTECFFNLFETEVHNTIIQNNLFSRGDRVACGASGGKDSTVLMHLMKTLNERYDYGIELVLVSIDEGIVGYRDDSLLTVHRNSDFYQLPLKILSYKELYGWTMDEIVKEIGSKNNCTFCGVFRRQALDRGAVIVGANKVVTGHNADDTAETILMNILRSDGPRLQRCASTTTENAGGEHGGQVPRVKPLKYAYEKEIVLYAHFKKLDYFTTECTYSKEAFRGNTRTLVKDLEAIDPRTIRDIIYSGERLPTGGAGAAPKPQQQQQQQEKKAAAAPSSSSATAVATESSGCCGGDDNACEPSASPAVDPTAAATTGVQQQNKCVRCGYITSRELCRACVLLSALNRGKAKIALRVTGGSLKDEEDDRANMNADGTVKSICDTMRPNVNLGPAVISSKSQGEKH